MTAQNMENLIRSYFGFLFNDYGFTMNKSTYNKLTCEVYRLTSDSENIIILVGRGLCTILFWPASDSEENALTTDWLYDYYKNRSLSKIKDSLLAVGETESVTRCFTEHRNKMLEMKGLLFSPNHDWWKSAKAYTEKRIELIKKKYSATS